jgi:micrococcal nuclease
MRSHPLLLVAIIGLIGSAFVTPGEVRAGEAEWRTVPGPVPARIIRVIDGDTVLVVAHPWPGHAVRVSVRLRGIDTPERRSRCDGERRAANQARRELERLVSNAPTVNLINVSGGKYYGRVLADLKAGARDVAAAMLQSGLATPYKGGKRQRPSCADFGS